MLGRNSCVETPPLSSGLAITMAATKMTLYLGQLCGVDNTLTRTSDFSIIDTSKDFLSFQFSLVILSKVH